MVKKYYDVIAWPIPDGGRETGPRSEDGEEETVTIETENLNSIRRLWQVQRRGSRTKSKRVLQAHRARLGHPLEAIAMKA